MKKILKPRPVAAAIAALLWPIPNSPAVTNPVGNAAGATKFSAESISIICFLIAALLGAVGQFLYKSGAERASGSLMTYVLNGRIALGVLCYLAVMVLFVAAFKRGGSPSVLYPIYASTFIWAAVLARFIYDQPIRPKNLAGMALLVGGMYLMGK